MLRHHFDRYNTGAVKPFGRRLLLLAFFIYEIGLIWHIGHNLFPQKNGEEPRIAEAKGLASDVVAPPSALGLEEQTLADFTCGA
jgi:hypothetical protein